MDVASPQGRVSTWLAKFNDALEIQDIKAIKALFADTCYWRDLIALTWNIKTMEGRDAIAEMAAATLKNTHPRNFEIDGDVTEADGVAEAWLRFETDAARGIGHVRLGKDGAITLLTTAQELKGYEEHRGRTRDHAPVGGDGQ